MEIDTQHLHSHVWMGSQKIDDGQGIYLANEWTCLWCKTKTTLPVGEYPPFDVCPKQQASFTQHFE